MIIFDYVSIIITIILVVSVFVIKSMMKQLRRRIELDNKLRAFLIEEITKNNLDVDKIESVVRKNTLKIRVEKELDDNEIYEFRKSLNKAIYAAINRLADEEKLIIYRSIQNSNKNNTSQYQNKILLDSIEQLKHA